MANLTPTPKMAATGVTGSAAIVLVWLLGQFGIDMPEYVAAAVTLLLSFAGGWLMPESRGEHAAD